MYALRDQLVGSLSGDDLNGSQLCAHYLYLSTFPATTSTRVFDEDITSPQRAFYDWFNNLGITTAAHT